MRLHVSGLKGIIHRRRANDGDARGSSRRDAASLVLARRARIGDDPQRSMCRNMRIRPSQLFRQNVNEH